MTDGTGSGTGPAASDQEKAQRQDEIIAAAKKVFAKNGFQATTVSDIAEAAGLEDATVHLYFDSKADLFRRLIAVEEYALRTHVAIALASSGTGFGFAQAPFRASLRATFEFFDANPATAKLLFRDAYALDRTFDKQLSGVYERFIDDIEALIAAAQERGDVLAAPPRLVAYMLTSLIGQMAHRRLITTDGVSAAEAADLVVALVINGLRPSPG
jgi:AcrR family transcriptional regulator